MAGPPEDLTGVGHDAVVYAAEQPKPIPNANPVVWDLVIEDMAKMTSMDLGATMLVLQDMRARDEVGRKRYGTPLQTFNGRDMRRDLYDELLDAVVYLRGAMEEAQSHDGAVAFKDVQLYDTLIAAVVQVRRQLHVKDGK